MPSSGLPRTGYLCLRRVGSVEVRNPNTPPQSRNVREGEHFLSFRACEPMEDVMRRPWRRPDWRKAILLEHHQLLSEADFALGRGDSEEAERLFEQARLLELELDAPPPPAEASSPRMKTK
jgi:hypothetical protein